MVKKNSLILDNEFIVYCQLNEIDDINKLAKETFNKGFSLLKYGETPTGFLEKEKIVEKEVIKEIIREVLVEKIVEVIKEVPVQIKGDTEVITKEIIKEVFNDEEIERLKKENEKLKKDLETITNSLNKFSNGKYMKSSNLGSLYDE
jgi:hypothetical protein